MKHEYLAVEYSPDYSKIEISQELSSPTTLVLIRQNGGNDTRDIVITVKDEDMPQFKKLINKLAEML